MTFQLTMRPLSGSTKEGKIRWPEYSLQPRVRSMSIPQIFLRDNEILYGQACQKAVNRIRTTLVNDRNSLDVPLSVQREEWRWV